MSNMQIMKICHCKKARSHELTNHIQRNCGISKLLAIRFKCRALRESLIRELVTFRWRSHRAEFHDQVDSRIAIEDLLQPYTVGVVQSLENRDLKMHWLQLRGAYVPKTDYLASKLFFGRPMTATMHWAKPPFAYSFALHLIEVVYLMQITYVDVNDWDYDPLHINRTLKVLNNSVRSHGMTLLAFCPLFNLLQTGLNLWRKK